MTGRPGNISRRKRDVVLAGAAVVAALAGAVLLRLLVPSLDYFPPERLIQKLQRSLLVSSGMRKPAIAVYAAVAFVLMAVFFNVVQQRWPGRGTLKGFVFGASLGIVWCFGFFTGWAFLGTTLRAELLNCGVDLIILALAGWLIGLAFGSDTPRSQHRMWKPWLAVILVGLGFVTVHALGATLLENVVASTADLLLVPMTPPQVILLFGLGLWSGGMFVVLRPGLPFDSTLARVAFFAFGVFGHSWAWFHIFFVIEFAGVFQTALLVGLIGALGVFAGALAYERLAAGRRQVDRPRARSAIRDR